MPASFTSTVRTSTGCSRKILSTPISWAESPLSSTAISLKSCLRAFARGGKTPAADRTLRTRTPRGARARQKQTLVQSQLSQHNNGKFDNTPQHDSPRSRSHYATPPRRLSHQLQLHLHQDNRRCAPPEKGYVQISPHRCVNVATRFSGTLRRIAVILSKIS